MDVCQEWSCRLRGGLRRERNFSDMLEVEEEPLESKWWGGLGG
jgi:hypothetical protein